MKKITLIVLATIVMVSCSKEEVTTETDSLVIDRIDLEGETTEMASTDLIAGQHINTGTVTVETGENGTFVTYDTTGDWILVETHLYVGSIEDLPSTNNGNPKIGHFPYDGQHIGNTTSVSYEIGAIEEGTCQYVFAHAVVQNSVTGQEETAWGDGFEAAGNNWAMYFEACN